MRNDPYDQNAKQRYREYKNAYHSSEAKAWIESLSPEQYVHAEKLGLLAPSSDKVITEMAYDEEILNEEAEYHGHSLSQMLENMPPRHKRAIAAFVGGTRRPELNWAVLRYLCGEGTCEIHAARLGMVKQTFDHHVKRVKTRLKKHLGEKTKINSAQEITSSIDTTPTLQALPPIVDGIQFTALGNFSQFVFHKSGC